MTRFLTAVVSCSLLLVLGLWVFIPRSAADSDLVGQLLELPAPPPPNPDFKFPFPERPEEFYNPVKPPRDDAPIDEVLDYWQRQSSVDRNRNFTAKPSDKTLKRLMEQIEETPERLINHLNNFAGDEDGVEFVKRLYDRDLLDRKMEREWRESVRYWLTYNSPYFSSELLRTAQNVRDENDYVTNQEEFLALAKVDWDRAQPLVNRLADDSSQPVSRTLARWALYQRAIDTNSKSDAEKYRKLLQATVEDRNEKPGNRDLALDALVRGGDFEGRDEWYLKLLGDETLGELKVGGQTYTGLTTMISQSPPDKFTDRMVEMLKSDSKTVRSAAIRNLVTNGSIAREDMVRLMLPWLDDPQWATDLNASRRAMINSLKTFRIPESVPGLLSVLNEREPPKSGGAAANANRAPAANVNANVPADTETSMADFETKFFISEVVQALGNQRDPRAVPAIRVVMTQLESWQKQLAVQAILRCGGFSIPEQVAAVEKAARGNVAIAQMANANFNAANVPVPTEESPDDMTTMLGFSMMALEDPGSELLTGLILRVEAVEKTEPAVGRAMREIIRAWKGPAVNALLLREIRNGRADTSDVVRMLARRKELRETQINDIYEMRGGSPTADGISACLLEQQSEMAGLLDGDNIEAKTAMLACARLIRAPLPVGSVAAHLGSRDKRLRSAAEKYLESEDSIEARAVLIGAFPNEARVFGARGYFGARTEYNEYVAELFASVLDLPPNSAYYFFAIDPENEEKIEKRLRKEVLENAELLGAYAYDDNFVRIYRDRAVFSYQDDPARFRERVLEPDEFDRLKVFLADRRVDSLSPFLAPCYEGCEFQKELLMIGRAGGRRVFQFANGDAPFFKELSAIFGEFRQTPAKLGYYAQKSVKGLEVLYESKDLRIETLWKSGPDFRVLVNNETRREQIDRELSELEESESQRERDNWEEYFAQLRKRREGRAYESYSWNRFAGGSVQEPAAQPPAVGFIPTPDQTAVQPTQTQWKARTSNTEIRASQDGLFRFRAGQLVKIGDGVYENPIVSGNGRWALVKKFGAEPEDAEFGENLVRVNLATGKQFPIPYDKYPQIQPIVWVPSQNKFLVGTAFTYEEGEAEVPFDTPVAVTTAFIDYFWVDPETGALTPAKGVSAPLAQQTYRSLQPVTGRPDEFWAAVPDEKGEETKIGTYNARTLAFKPIVTLPELSFDSMKLWVDEGEGRAYFAYEGHLLAVPIRP